MIAVKKQRFRASNFSKRQPHLMPPDISVRGFLGHAFVDKAEFCVVRNEPLLAGQHKSLAALLSGIGDGTANQLTGKQLIPLIQQPEVIAVILDPLDKFLLGCRFCRRKAGGFCRGDGSNVFFFCIGDLHSVFLLNG